MNERNFINRDFDLQHLEERFSRLFGHQQPRSTYVQALREQLKTRESLNYAGQLVQFSSRVLECYLLARFQSASLFWHKKHAVG